VAFESHDHTYKRTVPIKGILPKKDGVVYLGDGGWGMPPRPVHKIDETWYLAKALPILHFVKVTIEPELRRFLMIDQKGRVFDRLEQGR
jgi:hypothetical protein